MKILVGWWNPTKGALVDIPNFDYVLDPERWLPATVDVHPEQIQALLRAMAGEPVVDPPTGTVPAGDLGAIMKRRREELHLTKVAAAKQSGVSRTTWHELEEGTRSAKGMHSGTRRAILRTLGLAE